MQRSNQPQYLHNILNLINNLMTLEQLNPIHFQISRANTSNKHTPVCYVEGELSHDFLVDHYLNHWNAKEDVGDV